MELSCDQRESVTQEKTAIGFLDVGTPPPGFKLNDKGRAMISTPLVRSIQENNLELVIFPIYASTGNH